MTRGLMALAKIVLAPRHDAIGEISRQRASMALTATCLRHGRVSLALVAEDAPRVKGNKDCSKMGR